MEIANHIMRLQPGMYILRYPKNGRAPLSIGVAPSGPPGGKLERLATPGTHGTLLRSGADCIVIQVSEASIDLLVSAFLEKTGDTAPAVRLDQIALDAAVPSNVPSNTPASAPLNIPGRRPGAVAPAGPRQVAPAAAASELRVPGKGISVIGHVERTGEAIALPEQPLGDPAGDLRIEGFQLMWPDKPDGVDIAYGMSVEGAGALPVVRTGRFCGTRNQARRVTEVTFALIGARAAQFSLEGSAHFSGGYQVRIDSGVPLRGPSGAEHLVALRIQVRPAAPAHGGNPWEDPSRTKAFKAELVQPAVAVSRAAEE